MAILELKDWDKNKSQYSKKNSSLEQRIYLHNEMHDFNQNTSKRKEEKLHFFLKNYQKIKVSRRLVQLSIWRGGVSILNMNT